MIELWHPKLIWYLFISVRVWFSWRGNYHILSKCLCSLNNFCQAWQQAAGFKWICGSFYEFKIKLNIFLKILTTQIFKARRKFLLCFQSFIQSTCWFGATKTTINLFKPTNEGKVPTMFSFASRINWTVHRFLMNFLIDNPNVVCCKL